MRERDLNDAIFRESVRQLERTQKSTSLGKGKRKHNPKFIVERKAMGSTQWQPFSSHFSRKKAEKSCPANNEHYEYRIQNGSQTT